MQSMGSSRTSCDVRLDRQPILPDNGIVDEMPALGVRVYPGRLVAAWRVERCVGGEVMLIARSFSSRRLLLLVLVLLLALAVSKLTKRQLTYFRTLMIDGKGRNDLHLLLCLYKLCNF